MLGRHSGSYALRKFRRVSTSSFSLPSQSERVVNDEHPGAVGLFTGYLHTLAVQFHWTVRPSSSKVPSGGAKGDVWA